MRDWNEPAITFLINEIKLWIKILVRLNQILFPRRVRITLYSWFPLAFCSLQPVLGLTNQISSPTRNHLQLRGISSMLSMRKLFWSMRERFWGFVLAPSWSLQPRLRAFQSFSKPLLFRECKLFQLDASRCIGSRGKLTFQTFQDGNKTIRCGRRHLACKCCRDCSLELF